MSKRNEQAQRAMSKRKLPPSQRPERAGYDPVYDPNAIHRVAVHEAGHGVVAVVLGIPLNGVDIKRRRLPDGSLLGGYADTGKLNTFDLAGKGEEVALPHMILALAGPVAESAIHHQAFRFGGCDLDFKNVRDMAVIALDIGTVQPDGLLITPDELKQNRNRLEALMERAASATVDLINQHFAAIKTVAKLLLERQEVSGEEVAAIVNA
jgi:hypothetical protein